MNFENALKEMIENGKMIRLPHWARYNTHMYYNSNEGISMPPKICVQQVDPKTYETIDYFEDAFHLVDLINEKWEVCGNKIATDSNTTKFSPDRSNYSGKGMNFYDAMTCMRYGKILIAPPETYSDDLKRNKKKVLIRINEKTNFMEMKHETESEDWWDSNQDLIGAHILSNNWNLYIKNAEG